ncbi:MAG: hypothetical protein LQ352_008251 [Teloschistes flavicans]|nr:MAG: hypothetical protein LQ352_008251 [Teloschistes flavicans]
MFTFKAAFTSLVVTPISYVLHPFIGHVTLEPNGQEKQPKLNHSVPEPAQAGKKLKSNPVVVAPEPKPQAKKTTSTRSVPQPKRQAKNLKSKLPASKPQRAIPKLSQMAPAPKREGKKVESKAKRSTGGPELERHIPWPAIFTHHVSNIEGHFRLLHMIREHTTEGSGNYRAMCGMIDRTNELLQQSKNVARSFVPSADQVDKVPLGFSSESTYPGYSSGDIKYGKASEKHGNHAADAQEKGMAAEEKGMAAKEKGMAPKPEDAEYKIPQSKAHSRLTLAQMQALKSFEDGYKSSPAKATNDASKEAKKTGHEGGIRKSAKASSTAAESKLFKGSTTMPETGQESSSTPWPSKLFTAATTPPTPQPPKYYHFAVGDPHNPFDHPYTVKIEFEDLTAEVDRRMEIIYTKERLRDAVLFPNPMKRKRESDNSFDSFLAPAASTIEASKPKTKKQRTSESVVAEVGVRASKKKRSAEVDKEEGKSKEEKAAKKRKGKDGEGKVVREGKDKKKRDAAPVSESKEEGTRKKRKMVV